MRKISRAQEQHGGLNFRNAHDESEYYRPNGYEDAIRAGASHEEVRDAANRHINLEHYAYARYAGASHEETLDAASFPIIADETHGHKLPFKLYEYARARHAGASHEEVLDAHRSGLNLGDYAYARHMGGAYVSHDEVIDAHKSGVKFAHARGNINFDDSDWRSQYSDLDSDW